MFGGNRTRLAGPGHATRKKLERRFGLVGRIELVGLLVGWDWIVAGCALKFCGRRESGARFTKITRNGAWIVNDFGTALIMYLAG